MFAQIICLILAYISTGLCTTTCFWSLWAVMGPESASVLGPIWAWRGIWADCMQIEGGQYYCEEEFSMLLEDAYKVAIRALMCLAICFSAISCFLLLIGMECTRILEEKPNSKRKLMFICATFFFISGAFTLISVSWYAAMVVDDFFSFENQDNLVRYELGPALYLGFIGSFFCIVTGLSICCMPGRKEETNNYGIGKPSYSPGAYIAPKHDTKYDYGKSGKGRGAMEYV